MRIVFMGTPDFAVPALRAVAEAVTAARKVGIELDALYKLVSAGGANSNIFQMVMPWVMNAGSDASSWSPIHGNCVKLMPVMRNVGRIATSV